MTTVQLIQKKFVVTLISAFCAVFAMSPSPVEAQSPNDVRYGGWGAIGGALAFSLTGAVVGGVARAVYLPPHGVDCGLEPEACRSRPTDHVIVGATVAAAIAGTYFAGYGSHKFAEHQNWNPNLGWSLAGAYLGLPTTIMLQYAIPQFRPDWLRELLGVGIAAGGATAAALAFRAIATERGHAWPEFGFGAGGMAVGLALGVALFDDPPWMMFLGGIGSLLGASAAYLAF